MRNQVSRILTIQRKSRELGRIRLGQFTGTGKGRPAKLEQFRFTSQSRPLLEKVAELYGGEVRDWTPQGGKAQAFEVFSESNRVPILVPPQAVSQAYEHWSGGGCQRRCDGERTVILGGKHSDAPCPCDPDPAERLCKPTTRLNVVLRDVEGVGVWRLETHGYYAAVELPAVAEFLANAQGGSYLPAHLILEKRTSKSDGKTKEYMVPGIEVEGVTPGQLMAGENGVTAIESGSRAAIESGPTLDEESLILSIAACPNTDELRELWRFAHNEKASTSVFDAIDRQAIALKSAGGPVPAAASAPVEEPSRGDVDGLWHTILMSAPEDKPTSEIEKDFESVTGVGVAHAGAEEMRRYLDHLAAA